MNSLLPIETCICQSCGREVTDAQWIDGKGNVCEDCIASLRGRIIDAEAALKGGEL